MAAIEAAEPATIAYLPSASVRAESTVAGPAVPAKATVTRALRITDASPSLVTTPEITSVSPHAARTMQPESMKHAMLRGNILIPDSSTKSIARGFLQNQKKQGCFPCLFHHRPLSNGLASIPIFFPKLSSSRLSRLEFGHPLIDLLARFFAGIVNLRFCLVGQHLGGNR